MSQSHSSALSPRKTSLARVGGALGIAANFIGLAIFLAACAGINAVLVLSILPLLLSVPGLVLTFIGGNTQNDPNVPDTHVLAAIFINIAGIVGALLLISAWKGWHLLG